jgi:hypothetical protein
MYAILAKMGNDWKFRISGQIWRRFLKMLVVLCFVSISDWNMQKKFKNRLCKSCACVPLSTILELHFCLGDGVVGRVTQPNHLPPSYRCSVCCYMWLTVSEYPFPCLWKASRYFTISFLYIKYEVYLQSMTRAALPQLLRASRARGWVQLTGSHASME